MSMKEYVADGIWLTGLALARCGWRPCLMLR
jgi:hypothetical protein